MCFCLCVCLSNCDAVPFTLCPLHTMALCVQHEWSCVLQIRAGVLHGQGGCGGVCVKRAQELKKRIQCSFPRSDSPLDALSFPPLTAVTPSPWINSTSDTGCSSTHTFHRQVYTTSVQAVHQPVLLNSEKNAASICMRGLLFPRRIMWDLIRARQGREVKIAGTSSSLDAW